MDSISKASATDQFQSLMASFQERNTNQQQRIANGILSGELTPQEVIRLERSAERIQDMAADAAEDGVLNRGERSRLRHAQNVQSRRIHRLKHNDEQASFAQAMDEAMDGQSADAAQPGSESPTPTPAAPAAPTSTASATPTPATPVVAPIVPPPLLSVTPVPPQATTIPMATLPAAEAQTTVQVQPTSQPQAPPGQPPASAPFLLTGLPPQAGQAGATASASGTSQSMDIPLDPLLIGGQIGSGQPFILTGLPAASTLNPGSGIVIQPSALPFDYFA